MENLINGDYHISIITEKVYSNADSDLFTTTLTIHNFEQFGKYGKCFEISMMHRGEYTESVVEDLKNEAKKMYPDAWKE